MTRRAAAPLRRWGANPLFLPFAPAPDQPLPEVRVFQVDADELADSDSARVKKLEDGSVPQVKRVLGGRKPEKTGHFFLGEERGDTLRLLGGGHHLGRVLGDPLLFDAELGKRTDGGGVARRRALFELAFAVV